MANNDSAAYELRYNEISQAIEAAIAGSWMAVALAISGTINSTSFTNAGTFSNTGTMNQNGPLIVTTDNTNTAGTQNGGSIVIRGATTPAKQFSIGYQTTGNYAWLQSIIYGTTTTPIIMQPQGGQVSVGVGTTVDASALLQINSTVQGVLFPRMTTTEKNAIAVPAEGLVVYDTTLHKLCVRVAAAWETITSA